MLQYFLIVCGLESGIKYYIKSSFGEETKLTWEANTIRFTTDDVIKQKASKIISYITLEKDSNSPTYKIKFKDNRYLCKRNKEEFGVISCKKDEGLTDWEVIDNVNETYAIRISGLCLKVKGKDSKLNGYYVHATTCENKDNEFFKFEEVLDEPKKETEPKPTPAKKDGEAEEAYDGLPTTKKLATDEHSMCPYYHPEHKQQTK